MVLGLDKDSYLEYENIKEFYDFVLALKPKDVRDEGISKKTLWNIKERIKTRQLKNKSKSLKVLHSIYLKRKFNA